MAILTGDEIRRMVDEGRITIDPFSRENIGPNSYDVTLSDELRFYTEEPLDVAKDNPTERRTIQPAGMMLSPGSLCLGCTVERFGSAEFVPWLDGRSSVARLGLAIHLTAGRGDLGFVGRWTLEITAVRPTIIRAGVRIGQVSFFATQGERTRQYQGKYQGDSGPQPSRMYRDFGGQSNA